MRLTPDTVLRARVSFNPLHERELDLRGHKIPALENLGATKDSFDCFDLSDNDIKKLENFPRLQRLRMLLLYNNQISRVQSNLGSTLPNLKVLCLSGNKISTMDDVDRLSDLNSLEVLSLWGNPVCKRPRYREYVISKFPRLRVLDFRKVHWKERGRAMHLMKTMVSGATEGQLPGIGVTGADKTSLSSFTGANKTCLSSSNTVIENKSLQVATNTREDVSAGSPSTLKVSELKEQLGLRGLPTSGLKAVLVKRLEESLK